MDKQVWAIKEDKRKKLKKFAPDLQDKSGIYVWHRIKEECCYVGQAKHIIQRSISHLMGHSHIDLSIRKHGLYDRETNPYGWRLDYYYCSVDKLNEYEREEILNQQKLGRTLYNITSGGQDSGKVDINERKASKGYHDGLKNGRKQTLDEIKTFFAKYLDFTIKGETNKIKERKLNEFKELLNDKE